MPDSKEIKFRVGVDTSDFNRQMSDLQRRLAEMTRHSDVLSSAKQQFGDKSKMGGYAQSFFGSSNRESVNSLREEFNLNVRKMQHEDRELRKRQREMKEIEKIESNMTRQQKHRLDMLKQETEEIKKRGKILTEMNMKIANQAQNLGGDLAGLISPTLPIIPQFA